MRAYKIIMGGLACIIIAMLVVPTVIPAQDFRQTDRFSEEELAQMLAPIALYPDSLIAQILMASTYPLELVEAERWLRQNKKLQGDKLDDALREKQWDPSIKSLCHFPDVLFALSDKLDQTRKLGDAFLSQQDEVMNTVQLLRLKAEEQGNLKTTMEQNVIVEKEIIRIEPADPNIVYVPVYDPFYVYGPWWYPAYPPWHWYYPPGVVISSSFIVFGPPFFIGFDLFLWPWFDWHGHHVYADYYYKPHSDRRHHHDRDSGKHYWEHDPFHRKGVAYRDRTTSRRFGPAISPRPRTGTETRGYQDGNIQRQDLRPRQNSTQQRQSVITPRGKVERDRATRGYSDRNIQYQDLRPRQKSNQKQQNTIKPKVRVERERDRTAPARGNTFLGIGNGNFERKASERGGVSRQREGVNRQASGTDLQRRESTKGSGPRDNSRDRGFRR